MKRDFPTFVDETRGRSDELDALAASIEPGTTVTIVGPGGMGKTRLATVFATKRFDGPASFVSLVNATTDEDLDRTIGRALGMSGDLHRDDLYTALAERPGELVVFDNVEQVIEPFARFAAGVEEEGALILVTSREPLRVRGEHVVRLDGLAPDAARTLFEDRYRAAGVEDVGDAVDELVQMLDGLPLALEIAAGRMASMTAADFLARFTQGLRVARSRRRDALERHSTLEAAIRWSWDMLGDDEQQTLQTLSLFAAPFPLDHASAALRIEAPEALELLSDLIDRSLVRFDAGVRRYSMLVAVRLFAREQWAAPERVAALEHLATILSERAEVDDIENLEGVMRAADAADVDDEIIVNVAQRLGALLVVRGEAQAAIDMFEELGERDTSAALAARRFITTTHAYQHCHRHEEAVALGRRAVECADATDDQILQAKSRMHLGGSLARVESFDDALRVLDEGLALVRGADDEETLNALTGNRGMVALSAGRLHASKRDFEEVLERARAMENPHHEALTLFHIAMADRDLGAPFEELLALMDRAKRLARTARNTRALFIIERFWAYMLADAGRVEEAVETLRAVEQRTRERGERTQVASVLLDIGRLSPAEKRMGALDEALDLAHERALRVELLTAIAGTQLELGDTARARARIIEATDLVMDHGPSRALLESLRALSYSLEDEQQKARDAWMLARTFIDPNEDLADYIELFEAAFDAAERGTSLDAADWGEMNDRLSAYHRVHMRYGYQNPVPYVLGALRSDRSTDFDLRLAEDGSWMEVAGEAREDFSRRTTLRRLILHFAERAVASDAPSTVEDLIEAGWPGESMTYDSGLNRVYSAIRTLRKLGLDDLLETVEDGYRLRPDTTVEFVEH